MNEYKIEKVIDFLKVPDSRIDDCLTEFRTFLEHMRALTELAIAGAESLGMDAEDAIGLMEFTWIDDGKTDVVIKITGELGE